MRLSTKARRGRRRHPQRPHDHHHIGATQDPVVRARRAAYRRTKLAVALAAFLGGQE